MSGETNNFKEWLAGGDTQQYRIQTIQISHPAWGDVYLANWDVDYTATVVDTGLSTTFMASRFLFEPSALGDTTEQSTGITMTAYGGILYDVFNDMTYADRQSPITITPREFLAPSNAQTVNPPPVWTLHNVTCQRESISGELKAAPLRINKCGLYYTAYEFPVLGYAFCYRRHPRDASRDPLQATANARLLDHGARGAQSHGAQVSGLCQLGIGAAAHPRA